MKKIVFGLLLLFSVQASAQSDVSSFLLTQPTMDKNDENFYPEYSYLALGIQSVDIEDAIPANVSLTYGHRLDDMDYGFAIEAEYVKSFSQGESKTKGDFDYWSSGLYGVKHFDFSQFATEGVGVYFRAGVVYEEKEFSRVPAESETKFEWNLGGNYQTRGWKHQVRFQIGEQSNSVTAQIGFVYNF